MPYYLDENLTRSNEAVEQIYNDSEISELTRAMIFQFANPNLGITLSH